MNEKNGVMDSKAGKVLVVDDEANIRDTLTKVLQLDGFMVDPAEDGEEAFRLLEQKDYDLVITDLRMPKVDGLQLLSRLNEMGSNALGIVITAYGSVESAVEALRLGAYDYITKPLHLEEFRTIVQKAWEFKTPVKEDLPPLRKELKQHAAASGSRPIIGSSAVMATLQRMIDVVADSDSTVLVLGESGTGKELVARAIHARSVRVDKPLVAVNCGAIPEELLESELFGHVKGAFTGASMSRIGRFQLADGGSIFLDEIGDMSSKLQVKLLRVLQEQTFEPVGSAETRKVNVRVIAATNRNLERDVADGRFREDLFYRLNVIPINIPSLRERIDDLPALIEHFIARFNKTKGRRLTKFSPETMEILSNYSWPGNIRELENLVERMAILYGEGEIRVEHLPEKFIGASALMPVPPGVGMSGLIEIPDEGINFNALVDQYERHLIQRALEKAGGVKNKAAALLGIKRTTLVEKMKKKGIAD